MGTLQGVADTLFIPLEARIYVSKKFPEYFYDEKALELEKYMPDDSIQKKSSEYERMASVARYFNMDEMVRTFMQKHKTCNVVYLGAGLETAYHRLYTPSVLFYEVDLPDVIEARRTVLGEQTNEKLIGGDMFNMEWAEPIDKAMPTLLLVSGVFQYFEKEMVTSFVQNLKNYFANAELIFDATNETGIKYANKYVQKTGNKNALMHFFVNDSAAFAKSTGTTLIEERTFFTDARKILSTKLGLYTRIAMRVVDEKKRAILIHLKIN